MDVIATTGLTKRYGRHTALQAMDLRVSAGRLFGFLGPNGAGKTTAIRLLLGLLRATAGEARVLGQDVWQAGPRLRADVGYLPGDVRLYEWMTGRRLVGFLNAARGGHCRREIHRLTERFELDLRRRIRTYSRGMKQKLGLIAAMMHRPKLLMLDEPTTGLDPLMREALYAELRAVVADGRTVLFSSHTLAEVDALCDEVAILRAGRLVEQERIDVLRSRALRHVDIRLPAAASLPEPLPAGLTVGALANGLVRATWQGEIQPLVQYLAACNVQDVTIAPPDLEDLFLSYYGQNPLMANGGLA